MRAANKQGLNEAVRAMRKLRKGQPTEADMQPPSTFTGPKRKPLPGQLSLDGREPPRVR